MKTLFKVLVLGIFITTIGVLSGIAQEQECADLAVCFEKFKAEKKGDCAKKEASIATGNKIIEKFGNDELNVEIINYVKKQIPILENEVKVCKRIALYDSSYKTDNWSQFISVSKEIIADQANTSAPLGLDVMLEMVMVSYEKQTLKKVDTYNNETLSFAKTAIQKLESGTGSQTGKFGTFNPFKTKAYPDGKSNALGWMNYIIGYINYYRLGTTDPGKKKEALQYFYKATQYTGENKVDPTIPELFGKYYFSEAAELDKKYRMLRTANNNTDNEESKAVIAMARGYADRGIDAFGRAIKLAAADTTTTPAYKATLKSSVTDLYKFRFNIAATAPTPDLDKYISDLLAKQQSMPDPSTEVTPVVEEVKPTTTTTTTTTPTTTKPTTTKPTTTKPATTKPATTTTTKPTTSTTTGTTVKKPVTKKKGNR